MKTIYIENKKCPFCKNKMKHKIVYCPNKINLPCLACEHCKKYFYTEPYYNVLSQLAKNANRNLNNNVYKYQNSTEERPINKIKNKQKVPLKSSKKPKTPQYKNTKKFDLRFQKLNNNLFLIIRLPIDYKKIHAVNGKYIFEFKSDTKNKRIDLRILLSDLESKINFLFDGFNNYIYPKSGILHIVLDDIPEITKNETPFNKMGDIIFIERSSSNVIGTVKLQIWINKGLVASSIIPLYENTSINIIEPQIQKNTKNEHSNSNIKNKTIENTSMEQNNQKSSYNVIAKHDVGITAIVINDSRSCIFKNHFIDDVIAMLRIATPNGNIKNHPIQAGYCNECDKYYILKDDFKMAQKLGSILCPVEDMTKDKIQKQYNTLISSTESRIHELGYNVIKKNKLTNLQRRVILANIMENTDISKYEIKTNINRCIKQHQNQSNYAEAVECWKKDYDFVSNYELGDMPQVKVDKIIIA